ncbi:hypothetical protein GOODEAATRI_010450, partial [Goodea atripinnis]
PTVGNKRKRALVLEEEEVVKSPLKRQQSSDLRPESISSVPGRSLEHCSLHPVTNGQVNGYHKESPDVETAEWDNEDVQNKDDPAPSACSDSLERSSDVLLASSGAQSPALSPHFISPDVPRQDNVPELNCRLNSSQASYSANIQTSSPPCNEQPTSTEKDSLMADIPPCRDVNGFHSERDLSDELVSVPKQLLVIKSLPTFTNILPDWTPLNAVHLAPCNMCCKKNQMRTMLLESDTNIVCALSGDDSTTVTDDANTSIGASTLLDTFEGLTHNDIITITLMELQPDSVQSEMQSLMDTQQTENPTAPLLTEEVISSPDSSVLAAGGDLCHSADAEPTPTSSQSQSESGDSSAGDPTFVCGAKRRRGRRPKKKKTVGRQRGKKATSSKDAPQGTPDAPSEPPKPVGSAENNTAPITKQTSTTSSTNNLPPSSTQNDRWSFLLSKHPLNQLKKNISHPPPTQNLPVITEVNPSQPVHSTPNPVKKPLIPSGIPKAPLLTEEGTGLPPKAAEMFGGFGAKSSNPSITLSSPLSIPPLPPAVLPNRPTPLAWTSDTSLPSLHENSSIKKPGSSKVPLVLSDTEALRYKLLKKLKAKKKKLAKLNQLLGNGGGAHLRPDSTDLNSPSTVSSSTYDGSTCDDILSDLLSPATATGHLSPDSTGFFEMLASGQDGANQPDCVVSGARVVSQTNCRTSQHEDHNFLEEFLSQL